MIVYYYVYIHFLNWGNTFYTTCMNNHIATNNLFVKSKILFPVRYNNKSMFFHNKPAWQTYNCYYGFTQECPSAGDE